MSQFFRPSALSGAALVLLMAAPALAQSPALVCGADHGPSRLSVSGEGQARIAPDLATVQLGVTTQADSAAEAMRQNASQQNAVIEALRGAGLADADIQTSGLNLSPLMDYSDGQAPRVTGYQASNIVAIRVTDLAGLGGVLDAIVEAGANEIRGIDFSRENGLEAVDEARRDAVADARRKAEVLAEAAGLTLGPVLSLRDQPRGHEGPRPMMRMEAAMADASTPVQPGELSMEAAVEIEYALIGDGACMPAEAQQD
ncbi:SIMPL domain-containing protein [Paracoccus sp. (in: a-proteobacteria)]|uniref:SIMPL domain-containing protein n=1 Tax=Paracoccus sp. TaxID=267 RepID=UPI00272ADE15|nr:SIMPL domain-containing protein [Paracoccus sp. (in: a-proteobacteria)]